MSLQKTKFLKEKVDKKLVVRHYLFQALIILMFAIVLYDSFFNEIPFYYICYLLMGLLVGRILSVAEHATAEAAHAAAQAAISQIRFLMK